MGTLAKTKARKQERGVGTVLILAGLALLVFTYFNGDLPRALSHWSQAKASVGWPTVEGQMKAAWVKTERGSHSSSTSVYHTPTVSYSYVVEDQTYQGERLRYARVVLGNRAGESTAKSMVAPYQGRETVTVYYDPDSPWQSVLEPGLPDYQSYRDLVNIFLWFLFGLAIMGAGAWFVRPYPKK